MHNTNDDQVWSNWTTKHRTAMVTPNGCTQAFQETKKQSKTKTKFLSSLNCVTFTTKKRFCWNIKRILPDQESIWKQKLKQRITTQVCLLKKKPLFCTMIKQQIFLVVFPKPVLFFSFDCRPRVKNFLKVEPKKFCSCWK